MVTQKNCSLEAPGSGAAVADRRRLCAGLATLAALALPILAARPAVAANDFNSRIGWRSLSTGLEEALQTVKPVFLVVHADWCPACRTYTKLFHDTGVVEKLTGYVPVLINADRNKSSEQRFRPDGGYIPRSLLLSHKGKHWRDLTGPYDSKYFLPPGDPDFLLHYLDQGLARAEGHRVASLPVRKTVPGSDGLRPSFQRVPGLGGGEAQSSGGPKRIRVPGAQRSAPVPESAEQTASAQTRPLVKSTPKPETSEPQGRGLLNRVFEYFF